MVDSLVQRMSSWWAAFLATVFLGIYAYLSLVPASSWMTVKSMRVPSPLHLDESPTIIIEREIHRDFVGNYTIEAKKLVGGAEWTTHCHAEGTRNYTTDMVHEVRRTLYEWTNDTGCDKLPAGTYQIVVSWLVRPTLGDPRTVIVRSNPFIVENEMSSAHRPPTVP